MQSTEERAYIRNLLEILAGGKVPSALCRGLIQKKIRESAPISDADFYEITWKLVREGLAFLKPLTNTSSPRELVDLDLTITERGREFLQQEGQYNPDDPDGYLNLLRIKIPEIDELVLKYLREALLTYRTDCCLASAVMLGCASERAILLLGEEFIETLPPGSNQEFIDLFSRQGQQFSVKLSELTSLLKKRERQLPSGIRGRLDSTFNGMAELIRRVRNDAGHPTGVEISKDQIRINLNTAAYFIQLVFEIKNHFAAMIKKE